MAQVPVTSTTLLRNISADAQHYRWGEFVRRYQPMMEDYLKVHFPGLEADAVADSFGITRNAVDQMKSRMMTKLREIVGDLKAVV